MTATAAQVEEARLICVRPEATGHVLTAIDRVLERGDVAPVVVLAMVRQVRLIVETQHAQLDLLRARAGGLRVC